MIIYRVYNLDRPFKAHILKSVLKINCNLTYEWENLNLDTSSKLHKDGVDANDEIQNINFNFFLILVVKISRKL